MVGGANLWKQESIGLYYDLLVDWEHYGDYVQGVWDCPKADVCRGKSVCVPVHLSLCPVGCRLHPYPDELLQQGMLIWFMVVLFDARLRALIDACEACGDDCVAIGKSERSEAICCFDACGACIDSKFTPVNLPHAKQKPRR
jgi:hypothetical protein